MTTPSSASQLPPGRAQPRGARHKLLRRAVSIVALVAVTAVGCTYLLIRHYEDQLSRVRLHPPIGAQASGAQNFLLVGSDSRVGVGSGFGSAAVIAGQRSDTVMVAHLPAGAAKATLISFPRDSYVQIPAYTDPSGRLHQAHMDKLNAAYALGGPQLLVDTIHNLTGLRIDHYVEVNFAGFERMVNAVGGITLCARTSRHDPATGANGGSNDFMTAGVHHVNGAVALAFVRDRHSFADQDISRIHDQQYFLAQLMKKVLSLGTLTDPFQLNAFLDAATKSLRVDAGLSLSAMHTLADRLRHLDPAHVEFVTYPFSNSNAAAVINGAVASVVRLDAAADAQLIASLDPATRKPLASLPPRDVSLRVENATAIPGLAHKVATGLRGRGFRVTRVGNALGFSDSVTTVTYPPSDAAAAGTVAGALARRPRLQPAPGATGVALIVGSDFAGVATVSRSHGTATPPPPTPSAGGSRRTAGPSLSCGA